MAHVEVFISELWICLSQCHWDSGSCAHESTSAGEGSGQMFRQSKWCSIQFVFHWPLTLNPAVFDRPPNSKDWVAAKEHILSYHIGETILITLYTHYGNPKP